ncbi:stage III sporulation protein AF [Bacillus smithii]|uniref:stage III sporulation protein AF n=1 Tax=Bacillus smithii TaxID=1479 RepID=UPI0022E7F59B|nr:stage III sporulation protein AF [Bacillus smithii]
MDFFAKWIANIILLLLFAVTIEMLLPSSTYQKYLKIIVGLILIVVLLTPLLSVFSGQFQQEIVSAINTSGGETWEAENQLNQKKNEIQASQREYILKQMAVQLKHSVEKELVKKYKKEIVDVQVEMKDQHGDKQEDINKIKVVLKDAKDGMTESVQEVNIDIHDSRSSKPHEEEKKIAAFLAKQWGENPEKIVVLDEEGTDRHGF